MPAKVVLSFGSVEHAWVLMAGLAKEIEKNVAGIIVENRVSLSNRLRFLKDRFRRYELIDFLDQMAFIFYRQWVNDVFPSSAVEDAKKYLTRFPCLKTESINDDSVRGFLEKHRTDFLFNLGTGYIKKKVLDSVGISAVNIHAGLNPRYRGADPIVWTIYEKNFDALGGTLHLIDEGLDTGKILFRRRISLNKADSIEGLRLRAIQTAMEAIPGLLSYYEEHRCFPSEELEPLEVGTYGWYGLSRYLKAKQYLREKISRIS